MQLEILSDRFGETLIQEIKKARKSIDIIIYDWRFYDNEIACTNSIFNQQIIQSKKRGIKIRAIVGGNEAYYKLKSLQIPVKRNLAKGKMHIKLMILDSENFVMGSHNYTKNAFQTNTEMSIIVKDKEKTAELQNFFEKLWTTL